MPKAALIAAGSIFLVVALLHTARLVYDFEFKIGFDIPLWLNVVGSLVSLALAALMFWSVRVYRRLDEGARR